MIILEDAVEMYYILMTDGSIILSTSLYHAVSSSGAQTTTKMRQLNQHVSKKLNIITITIHHRTAVLDCYCSSDKMTVVTLILSTALISIPTGFTL